MTNFRSISRVAVAALVAFGVAGVAQAAEKKTDAMATGAMAPQGAMKADGAMKPEGAMAADHMAAAKPAKKAAKKTDAMAAPKTDAMAADHMSAPKKK